MDKKKFVALFNGEDINNITKIYEKYIIAEKTYGITFCNDFYSPSIWTKLLQIQNMLGVNVKTYGMFDESDRRMIAFYTYECEDFPMSLLKVDIKNKFMDLKHKDFLGSVMALGIKREKFGDFILSENSCYFPVSNDILEYIMDNLVSIRNNNCKINVIDSTTQLPEYKFTEKIVLSTSNRLDCIVSAITGISRAKSADLVSSGSVLVNYAENKEKNYNVLINTVITIRGYGKFKVIDVVGNTAKDRLKLLIKYYN